MNKIFHEIRDPIHVFIKFNDDERQIINSEPFQRLRFVHQLAMCFLVYPGATHRRFEHSLGVMEMACKIFDTVTNPDKIHDKIRNQIPEIGQSDKLHYWRKIVRIAALCHDLGHLPFSHAAENELLPEGWDHEQITKEIILSEEMQKIWKSIPVKSDDIIKVALGPKKARDLTFTLWETILSEIITSDFFGADRIDYLIRDSLHAGVAYGKFDYHRLIDTIRILPPPSEKSEPTLGVESGGIHSAEALMLARYFMFKQVYLHPVRRIYDIHLKDFLKRWLPEGKFLTKMKNHLALTDCEIMAAIRKNSKKKDLPGYKEACIILKREHYRLLYERNPSDIKKRDNAPELVYKCLIDHFGTEKVKYDQYPTKGGIFSFPVLTKEGKIVDSLDVSETLQKLPEITLNSIYIEHNLERDAREWLENEKNNILNRPQEEEDI